MLVRNARLNVWMAVSIVLIVAPVNATPAALSNVLSLVDSPPEITTAYLDKAKYQPGDQMLITAAVSDDWGIKKVQAQVENEKGYDTVNLILVTGNGRKGTWQGAWKLHDTVGVKEYKTKIIATDLSGRTAEETLLWIDPVQSHPASQIKPGAFQSGDYSIPGKLGIGTDATAGDRLKVKATSGNAINAECTSCDALYSYSSGGYSGYFTGGNGVKIENGLNVVSGTVSVPANQIDSSEANFNYAGSGSKGGAATTALALSADGSNCAGGQYAQGVDVSGNAQGCSAPAAGISGSGTANYIPKWTGGTSLGNSIIYDNGNVGIGTTSPTRKLEVQDNIPNDNVVSVRNTNANGYSSVQFVDAVGVKQGAVGWSNSGSETYLASAGSSPVDIWTNNVLRIRVDSSGSVGIGTTNPMGNIGLHLNASKWDYTSAGGMVVQAAESGVDPGIMFFNAEGKERGAIGQALAGGRWSQDANAGDVVLRSAQGRLVFSTDNVNFPPYTPSPSYPARMVIDNNGNIGIGTVSPSEKLEVNGNIKATAFLYSSDRRLKENIQKIDNPLEKIMMVDGVSFTWKESGEKGIGLTAQNVETVFPELVKTDNVSGMKSVEYGNLVAPLIEAVKEQQKIIKGQQVLIDNLQNKIEALKTEIKK